MTMWPRGRIGVALLLLLAAGSAHGQGPAIVLSTTTSTQDSGLLDVLVPLFEEQTRFTVKTVAVGSGQALALAARGEADVVLAHAPALERKYVAEGKLLNRRLVMYNDFVIVGPPGDPARVRSARGTADAMLSIARAAAPFVSRGDSSGTHALERALWQAAGVAPAGGWYIESGQGMGAVLRMTDEKQAYTLTDRGTYLAFQKRVALAVLSEGDPILRNLYSVLETNPANGPRVNTVGGRAFADFMVSPETQAVIGTFGVREYGQALFVPFAGGKESEPAASR